MFAGVAGVAQCLKVVRFIRSAIFDRSYVVYLKSPPAPAVAPSITHLRSSRDRISNLSLMCSRLCGELVCSDHYVLPWTQIRPIQM